MNKRNKAEAIITMAWILIALLAAMDLQVLSTTTGDLVFDKTKLSWDSIVNSIQLRINFYSLLVMISVVFYFKQNEIMNWLEIHAPF